ncbi:MAG: hypothetical protein B7733_12800 [Myxococcales bacterium FL481]|nr:MAG: hypothetical protein B7733_12800 [Myxococcales bacterium FL481]
MATLLYLRAVSTVASAAVPPLRSQPVLAISLVWRPGHDISAASRADLFDLGVRWSAIDGSGACGLVPLDAEPDATDVLDSLGQALTKHDDDLAELRADFCTAIVCRLDNETTGDAATIVQAVTRAGVGVEQIHHAASELTLVVADRDRERAMSLALPTTAADGSPA